MVNTASVSKAHAAPFQSQLLHRKLGLVPKPPSQWSASLCALTARAWQQCLLASNVQMVFPETECAGPQVNGSLTPRQGNVSLQQKPLQKNTANQKMQNLRVQSQWIRLQNNPEPKAQGTLQKRGRAIVGVGIRSLL